MPPFYWNISQSEMVEEGWVSFPLSYLSFPIFPGCVTCCQPLSVRLRSMQLIRIHNLQRKWWAGRAEIFKLPCLILTNLIGGSSIKIFQMQPLWVYISHAKQPEEERTRIICESKEFEKGRKVGGVTVYLVAAAAHQESTFQPPPGAFLLLVGRTQAFQTHTRVSKRSPSEKQKW